jgi:hypothetical protein
MKAASFSITVIPINQSTRCYISEDWNLHQHSCEKLSSPIYVCSHSLAFLLREACLSFVIELHFY